MVVAPSEGSPSSRGGGTGSNLSGFAAVVLLLLGVSGLFLFCADLYLRVLCYTYIEIDRGGGGRGTITSEMREKI